MWTVDRLMLRSKLQREQHELIPSNQCRLECELRQGPNASVEVSHRMVLHPLYRPFFGVCEVV